MFASGGRTWRLRFVWCTVHGNRSAMLANVSPHKENISLVRQVCDDDGPRPVVFPSGIHPSPFCPCGNVHTLLDTQPQVFCIQRVDSTVCPLTWLLHKPLPFLFFFLLLHWVFSSGRGQQSTQLSVPSSSLSSAQWWGFEWSPAEGKETHGQKKDWRHCSVCLQDPEMVPVISILELLKPDLLHHGCICPQSRRHQNLLGILSHCPPCLRSSRGHYHCRGGTNLEKHMENTFFHYLSLQ